MMKAIPTPINTMREPKFAKPEEIYACLFEEYIGSRQGKAGVVAHRTQIDIHVYI